MSAPIVHRQLGWGHDSAGHQLLQPHTDIGSSHPWGPNFGYDMTYGKGNPQLHGLNPEESRVLSNKHGLGPLRY